MQDAAVVTHPLISRGEALVLADTVEMLRAVSSRAAKASWQRRDNPATDEPRPYDYGRCAESCERAAQDIQNALITLSVWGKSAAADAGLHDGDDTAA